MGLVLSEWDVRLERDGARIDLRLKQDALGKLDDLKQSDLGSVLGLFEGKLTGVVNEAGEPMEYSADNLLRLLLNVPGLLSEFTAAFDELGARLGAAADPLPGGPSSRAGKRKAGR